MFFCFSEKQDLSSPTVSFLLPLKERVKATPMQNLVARDEQLACAFVCASSSPVAENVYQLLTTEFFFLSSRAPVRHAARLGNNLCNIFLKRSATLADFKNILHKLLPNREACRTHLYCRVACVREVNHRCNTQCFIFTAIN